MSTHEAVVKLRTYVLRAAMYFDAFGFTKLAQDFMTAYRVTEFVEKETTPK